MYMKEAKRLFFAYDGSCFYMSRDGAAAKYLEAGVPPEFESAWLDELTRIKLRSLRRKGNWKVLRFLNHHADYGHLAAVAGAEPNGLLWERCAFLEEVLHYAREGEKAGLEPSMVAQVVRGVVSESERLLNRARSKVSVRRIQAILIQARQTLERV
jgi:hypothetical protein